MTTSTNENFELVIRPHGECWKHKIEQYWIVFYESLKNERKPCYSAYRSIEFCAKDRDPWTVNNKTVGKFHNLEAAMQHVESKQNIAH